MARRAEWPHPVKMGLSVSDAIRLLLSRSAVEQALPFAIEAPNAETRAAMAELNKRVAKSSDSVAGLVAKLNAEEPSTAFKGDYRRAHNRYPATGAWTGGWSLYCRLVGDRPPAPRSRDHALSGNWSGYRDCHLWPDLLITYSKPLPDVLRLLGLGSHSDLFE